VKRSNTTWSKSLKKILNMSGREINAVKHLGEVEMFTMCTIHIIFFQTNLTKQL